MNTVKNYSELLEALELTSAEQKALDDLKTIPRYKYSWPRGFEEMMEPLGMAHAKLAVLECLKEAKNLANSECKRISTIYLQNTWFFSFNLFNANQLCCYAYQMDNDLFMGIGKDLLCRSFNNFVTGLFGTPEGFKRFNRPAWNWNNIVIDFEK